VRLYRAPDSLISLSETKGGEGVSNANEEEKKKKSVGNETAQSADNKLKSHSLSRVP